MRSHLGWISDWSRNESEYWNRNKDWNSWRQNKIIYMTLWLMCQLSWGSLRREPDRRRFNLSNHSIYALPLSVDTYIMLSIITNKYRARPGQDFFFVRPSRFLLPFGWLIELIFFFKKKTCYRVELAVMEMETGMNYYDYENGSLSSPLCRLI